MAGHISYICQLFEDPAILSYLFVSASLQTRWSTFVKLAACKHSEVSAGHSDISYFMLPLFFGPRSSLCVYPFAMLLAVRFSWSGIEEEMFIKDPRTTLAALKREIIKDPSAKFRLCFSSLFNVVSAKCGFQLFFSRTSTPTASHGVALWPIPALLLGQRLRRRPTSVSSPSMVCGQGSTSALRTSRRMRTLAEQ